MDNKEISSGTTHETIANTVEQKPATNTAQKVTRRTFTALAGGLMAKIFMPGRAEAQQGESKSPEPVANPSTVGPNIPLEDMKPKQSGTSSEIVDTTAPPDFMSGTLNEAQTVPVTELQRMANETTKLYMPEGSQLVKVTYQEDPEGVTVFLNANEIVISCNQKDPKVAEYIKMATMMGVALYINGAEPFAFQAKQAEGVDFEKSEDVKRLDPVKPLFDISNYIKGPKQEFDMVTSDPKERYFAQSFALLTFKKKEVLEKLKQAPSADQKLAAHLFLSSIEAMVTQKRPETEMKKIGLDDIVPELVKMSGRSPGWA